MQTYTWQLMKLPEVWLSGIVSAENPQRAFTDVVNQLSEEGKEGLRSRMLLLFVVPPPAGKTQEAYELHPEPWVFDEEEKYGWFSFHDSLLVKRSAVGPLLNSMVPGFSRLIGDNPTRAEMDFHYTDRLGETPRYVYYWNCGCSFKTRNEQFSACQEHQRVSVPHNCGRAK